MCSGDKLFPLENFYLPPRETFFFILNETGNLTLYTFCVWKDSTNILWTSNTASILTGKMLSISKSRHPPVFWLEMLSNGDIALLLSKKKRPSTERLVVSKTEQQQQPGVGTYVLLWRTYIHTAPANIASSSSSTTSITSLMAASKPFN